MWEETKTSYEKILRKAFLQVRDGCGRTVCFNPFCAANQGFPRMSEKECLDYILSLVGFIDFRQLSESISFIFCSEIQAQLNLKSESDKAFSFLMVLSNIELFGVHFLTGTPSHLDPKVSFSELSKFTEELRPFYFEETVSEEFFVSIFKKLTFSKYAQLYLPRSCLLYLVIFTDLSVTPETFTSLACLIPSYPALCDQLSTWFDIFSLPLFEKLLNILQKSLSFKYEALSDSNSYDELHCLLKLVDLLWKSNTRQERMNYKVFYNEAVNKKLSIQEEYRKWKLPSIEKRRQPIGKKMSFLDFPWIVNCGNKTKFLQQENYEAIEHEFNQFLIISLLSGGIISPYLQLEIDRERMLEDTIQQFNMRDVNLKKPLKIKFVGEEGVDEGGVKKEFFHLIVRKLFEASQKIFNYKEVPRVFWFNSESNDWKLYELLGILLGLAIYNGVNLDVRLPMVFYKKLQGLKVGLEDLKELDEAALNSLEKMLDNKEDARAYCLSFVIEVESDGARVQHELIDGGKDALVDNQNKNYFAHLYADWVLTTGVQHQFDHFKKGFLKICGGGVLRCMQPEELELILCGSPVFDLNELEKSTTYENGYSRDSKTVSMLWKILHSLDIEHQKKFLFFVTGSDRVPVNGLSSIHFVVSRNGPDTDRLMTAHTCYNYLLLPEYTCEAKMRRLLLTAINNSEGFGLR